MRHGDVRYFAEDGQAIPPEVVPLTDVGFTQAEYCRMAFHQTPLDVVINSGLIRTEQTSQLVIAGRAIAMRSDFRWREIQTGKMTDWASLPQEEIMKIVLGSLDDDITAETPFFKGETFGSCQSRVLEAWNDLLVQSDWRSALIVAHGVVNRLLLAHCLGAPLSSLGRIEQDACCLNLIEIDANSRPTVRLLNHTPWHVDKAHLRLSTFEKLLESFLKSRPA
jgi:probable phosphoglycerate mutase